MKNVTFGHRLRFAALALGLASLASTASSGTAHAQSYAPVAVVNDEIITGYDVAQRALLLATTTGATTPDTQAALDELIADVLRVQAARRAGIDPTPQEVRAGFDEIAKLNQRDPSTMRSALLSRGISSEALDIQIKAEVAWRRLILQRYGSRARVSDTEVDAIVGENTGAAAGETEYLLAEIRFPMGEGGEAQAKATARQAIAELTSGEAFTAVARARSSGPTAATGGDLGWTSRSRMSTEMADVVALMNVDRVSEPFVDGSDVVIVGLRGTREAGGGSNTTYTLSQLVVGVSPSAPQGEASAALARAKAVRAELKTCADVTARQSQYLPISGDLGDLPLAAMPGPVREAVSGLETGEITEPVRSNDGFHVIVVCDKKTSGPTGADLRDRASDAVRAKRLERYSRSLLRELKREAIIERR